MNITRLILLTTLLATPVTAMAQTANPITAGAKAQFDAVSGFLVRAAEKIPEDVYAFQPTADVRTVAQLVGHVADGFMGMCSTGGGGKPPRIGIEKSVTGKANLVVALKEAVAYCQTVYGAMTISAAWRLCRSISARAHAPRCCISPSPTPTSITATW